MNALDNANIKDKISIGLTTFALPEAVNSRTGVSVCNPPNTGAEKKVWLNEVSFMRPIIICLPDFVSPSDFLLIWGVIAIFAEPLAALVGNPSLGHVLIIACVSIPLAAFSSIQITLFKRNLDFKTLHMCAGLCSRIWRYCDVVSRGTWHASQIYF